MARKKIDKVKEDRIEGEGIQEIQTDSTQTKVALKPKDSSSRISFDSFFWKKLSENDGKLKPWKRTELKTFFTKLGLSTEEDLDKYEEAYKKY